MTAHFAANHFAAKHFALAHLRGVLEALAVKKGGDDAWHYRSEENKGWDKKKWLEKKAREDELEKTIQAQLNKLMGIEEPTEELIQEVAKQAIAEQPKVIQVPYQNFDGLNEWLELQSTIVNAIIQRRIEDDEEDVLLLLLA